MRRTPLLLSTAAAFLLPVTAHAEYEDILSRINLPDGFEISVFAEVPGARTLLHDPTTGVVFVSSRSDMIHAVVDKDDDGVADTVTQIGSGLNVPNGIGLKDGKLFIALNDQVVSWQIPQDYDGTGQLSDLQTVAGGFNTSPHHGWRYSAFGPDGKFYVALGAPCNICELEDNTGKIVRLADDGSSWDVIADGTRNSVGFDWHPTSGELWFTDNGADRMGDDIPPDELNRVTRAAQHFGYPYEGGQGIPLTGYEDTKPPVETTPAALDFQAHSANLGIDFYEGDMLPAEYRNDAIVAQHGSWNRSTPVGYQLMRIRFDDQGNATGKEVFADGWLASDETVYGRPVDIEELPDGSLLVSDDSEGLIYRITYSGS
ncbi:PQQ-dependent sugar dehydrogenase [Roseibium sp. CAU 1637]|uniref:PQQ-dependent sugar dehydrogenase n=1 Tax=Roseibium limicola TaxID=2816037 RepID=A0A939ET15_9HYPH|nr:PQQ-dependent sugar dehydrogenase [Roseibium limicola]MBO0346594.1 PQQ-dependent sugar dehydrogenase [Roseibium limicola]